MQQSKGAWTLALAVGLAAGMPLNAQEANEGANAVLPWAYVINDPDVTADPVDPDEVVTVPGSSVSMPRSAINIDNGPPDWHPDAHPPMPEVVARGGGEGVVACGYCHLPNGQGKPENAGVAGQPYEYIVQQMTDWRNGLRRPGEPRQGPTSFMERIGLATTDAEARIAAEYFASIDFKPWVRVVETDAVPVTRFAGWIHEVVEGGGVEPIGTRVVRDAGGPGAEQAARRLVGLHRLRAVGRGGAGAPHRAHRRRQLRGVHRLPRPRPARRRPRFRRWPAARRPTWRGSSTTCRPARATACGPT